MARSVRRPPELWLPRRRRWSAWAILVSIVLHVLLVTSVNIRPWLVLRPPRAPALTVLLPPGTEGQHSPGEVRYEVPGGADLRGRAVGGAPRVEAPPPPAPAPLKAPRTEQPAAPVTEMPTPAEPAPAGRAPGAAGERPYRIGPALGEGKLWVRPLPAPPREIAEALTRSHVQLVDSAVSAIVQAYIDSMLNAPSDPGAKLPAWTTQLFGKTFGLDSKYIYIAGLKIPAAVLALLPIRGGGVTMDFSHAARLAAIREDLAYAAQRSATLDDFKQAVRELRAERQRQKELERNQRQSPDTTKKPPPKPIP